MIWRKWRKTPYNYNREPNKSDACGASNAYLIHDRYQWIRLMIFPMFPIISCSSSLLIKVSDTYLLNNQSTLFHMKEEKYRHWQTRGVCWLVDIRGLGLILVFWSTLAECLGLEMVMIWWWRLSWWWWLYNSKWLWLIPCERNTPWNGPIQICFFWPKTS